MKGKFANSEDKMNNNYLQVAKWFKSILLALFLFGVADVSILAQPCLSGFQYRVPIALSNSLTQLTHYQILVTVNTADLVTAGKMEANGNDIRFLNRNGIEQSFWIVDGTMNTTSTQLWIKADTIIGNSTDTLFMFYGNPTAIAMSNASTTFDMYDAFDGSALSTDWSTCGKGSQSVGLGMLSASVTGDTIRLNHQTKLQTPIILEIMVSNLSSGRLSFGVVDTSGYGYASYIDTSERQVVGIDSGFCYAADSLNAKPSTNANGKSWFTWVSTGVQTADNDSGSLIATNLDYTLPDSVTAFISLTDTGNVDIDYFRARKYAAVVPSINFLAEVDMNFTIVQTYGASNFCEGDTIRLGVNDVVGASYKWTGPNGFNSNQRTVVIPNVTDLNSGTYSVDVTIPSGCVKQTSSVLMNVSPTTKGGIVNGISPVCEGTDSITLSLVNHVGTIQLWESADTTIGPWSNETGLGSTLKVYKPTSSKYYRAVVKSGACLFENSSAFLMLVDQKSNGGVTSSVKEVCTGSNAGEVMVTNYLGVIQRWESKTPGQANWSTIDTLNPTLPFLNIKDTTSFRVWVQNGVCPEVGSTTTVVDVNPIPNVNFTNDNLCEGVIVSFEETVSIIDGNITSYHWLFSDGFTSNSTTFNKSFGANGSYTVKLDVVSDKGCSASTTKTIIVGESPSAYFDVKQGLSPNTGCINQNLLLNNQSQFSDLSQLTYNWNFGNGQTTSAANPSINYKQDGNYKIWLKATSPLGCIDTFSMQFVIFKANKPIAGADVKAGKGVDVQLNAVGSSTYQWTPANVLNDANISNPIANVLQNTQFVVTGTDYYGCTSRDTVLVTVEEDYNVIPNNVITPDGNGSNDVWYVQNIENYPVNQVWVFDRWGQEVFTAIGYNNTWNVVDPNGHALLDGTYYYVIEFQEVGKTLKGAITVINNQ